MTHAGYNSPFYSPKRGIMQTEQAVTIEEHLHGFCCGKLEGEDVHVGTIIARNNKVFTGMFVFFLVFVYVCMSCHYYSLFLTSYFHLCKTKKPG